MERKECFGSMEHTTLQGGIAETRSRRECRDCEEFRDCLRYANQALEEEKEKDERRRQDMIAQIIDLSQIHSNEIGSCLLEFLNKIYSLPVGRVLFKNLLLFYEIPRETPSLTLTIPISSSVLGLIQGEEEKADPSQQQGGRDGFSIRIVLIQRSFPNDRKANMGLIASEVARVFSSDSDGVSQILQTLAGFEITLFKKLEAEQRVSWLMEKWGFTEEQKALKKEISLLEAIK